MPRILPISDLRNNFNAISEICHTDNEPVYITKNGKGDMVITSLDYFEKLQARIDLYEKLAISESDFSENRVITHEDLMSQIKERYNA